MELIYNFLKSLRQHNDREWFNEHKEQYQKAEDQLKLFTHSLAELMKTHDNIGDYKIFRIYRDVRFSNNKTPYNVHRSCSFKRATDSLRGGYYLRIEPGQSLIAGGFWNPNAPDLLHIRKQIDQDPEPLRAIIGTNKFETYFSELSGDRVKTAPKGFTKENPNIDLIRHKQFLVKHEFSDQEVLSPDFAQQVNKGFENMRPFFDYMSEILTTDMNGEAMIRES